MKTILWDWNGTLLDDVALSVECFNALLARHGLSVVESIDEYRGRFRFPVEDYYRDCGFDLAKTPFSELAREYVALYQDASLRCPLVAGSISSLEDARARGFRQIILSASHRGNLLAQVAKHPIEGFFSAILGIDDVYARSKVDLARRWMEAEGISGDEVIVIGDSLHDYEVARTIGARPVLFANGHQRIADEWRARCEVVDTLPEAIALLR